MVPPRGSTPDPDAGSYQSATEASLVDSSRWRRTVFLHHETGTAPRRCTAFRWRSFDGARRGVNVPGDHHPSSSIRHSSTRINSDDDHRFGRLRLLEYFAKPPAASRRSTPTQCSTTHQSLHCLVVASTDGPSLIQAQLLPPVNDLATTVAPPPDDTATGNHPRGRFDSESTPRRFVVELPDQASFDETCSPPRIPCGGCKVRSESRRAGVGIDSAGGRPSTSGRVRHSGHSRPAAAVAFDGLQRITERRRRPETLRIQDSSLDAR